MFIKKLRADGQLSQEQLSELSGLSLRTIQRLEAGHRVSYASLRALAEVFSINVDELEQKLYSIEKESREYKDFPLWLRLYIGSGWFAASRNEFKKTEVFFIILGLLFAALWTLASAFELRGEFIMQFASLCCFFGAYNISVTIRVGDKYRIWSKLETTLPKEWFSIFRKHE